MTQSLLSGRWALLSEIGAQFKHNGSVNTYQAMESSGVFLHLPYKTVALQKNLHLFPNQPIFFTYHQYDNSP